MSVRVKQEKAKNKDLKLQHDYFIEQIADLKRELCGMESQSNLIVFSSKHSTVSPSDNNTSTVQSNTDQNESQYGENLDSIVNDANLLEHTETGCREGNSS